jgi:hypothetical protein
MKTTAKEITEAKGRLLGDFESFETIFRSAGIVEAELDRKVDVDGEETVVTSRESLNFEIKEFLGTRDALWMFPRVVSNVLYEAAEPKQLVTPLLNQVRIGTGVRTVDYHAIGALQAHEMTETQEYQEEHLAWSEGTETAKVTKKGLRIPISEEMIEDSLFDLMALYLRAAGRAMMRLKESIAHRKFFDAAQTIMSNTYGPDVLQTSGVDSNAALNGTLDATDWLKVFGQIVQSGRTPTHILMNPLAWAMWAEDPIVRSFAWYNGLGLRGEGSTKVGGSLPNSPGFDNSSMAAFLAKTAPMGLQVIVSPFVPFNATTNTTDVYILDADDLGALTVRDDMSVEQFNDPTRDIVNLKVKERYDITVIPSEGVNIAKLEGIKVDRNYGREVQFTKALAGAFPTPA